MHYAMPARNMLDMSNPIFEKYAQDYKLHIISSPQIADDELEKFHSSLREVIGCIKYSNDKNKLAEFIYDNPRMNMEVEAARVIEAINHVPIRLEKGAEQFDMCKAIEEMIEDGRQEGREETLMRINQLIIMLSKENRSEDIVKAAADREYQEQLLKEFNL